MAAPAEAVTSLYHPAWHIPFQLDLMARSYLLRQAMVVADMGLGKTHVGMGLAAYLLMRAEADLVLVCCEKSKLLDWRDELAASTALGPVVIYHGPDRAKRLARGAQVIVTTYETARQDLAVFEKKGSRKAADGPLLAWLSCRRPVIIYDEASAKLGNRGSTLYKAHAHMLRQLRKLDPQLVVCAMTGTPIERDWENAFNAFRLLVPGLMPPVKEFETTYTYGRDDYGRLRFRKDRMHEFAARCQPRVLRKRKTDPDVVDQFPSKTEQFIRAEMRADQARIYKITEDLAWDSDGDHREVPGLSVLLRQLAGHPGAVLRAAKAGGSRLAAMLAETIGDELRACSCVKADLLAEQARQVVDEDAKLVAFTFFGQSVLPELSSLLHREGLPVFVTHGGLTAREQHEERQRFRTCEGGAVLLSSDAGARGVNLPEASVVVEYESAVTSATRQQRFDRAHRIGHGGAPLLCVTYCLEGTVEVPLLRQALARNEMQDILLNDESDESYVTAGDRRMLFAVARKRRII
jgi:SNF2 family DNA or RNA helicase